jgi:uncharacterized RDD family membrane protein YckC
MHCQHCGFTNGEEDHRCLRCGRRLPGIVIAAPPGYSGANSGANALAMAPAADRTSDIATQDLPPAAMVTPARQAPLFSATLEAALLEKVIPFEKIQRKAAQRPSPPAATQTGAPPQAVPVAVPAVKSAAQQPRSRSQAAASSGQGILDFVPSSPLRARMLKTDVEAQVFCEQPVATPMHRLVAAAIDAAFILVGFGILVAAFQLMGGRFGSGKLFWMGLAGALALVTLFYGLIWAIAGRETAGMSFTDLQLITFDGFPLDARSRAVRYVFTWMSFCAGGLGVLWAVADEENLTWHDHISKTFPTIREAPVAFVKQRR